MLCSKDIVMIPIGQVTIHSKFIARNHHRGCVPTSRRGIRCRVIIFVLQGIPKLQSNNKRCSYKSNQVTIDQVVVLNGEKVVGGFGSRGSSSVVEVFW